MITKNKCPKCGKETMPKIWFGIEPPICPCCGYKAPKPKVIY